MVEMLELQSVTYDIGSRVLMHDITASFGSQKYGLVGINGVGKSTLARMLAGELEPQSGRVLHRGHVAMLSQREQRPEGLCGEWLDEILSAAPRDIELIAGLLEGLDDAQPIQSLSGGEWMRLRLARVLSSSPSFLILDEPTNDLDREGKEVVSRLLHAFDGGILVISHDQELLRNVEVIFELTPKGLQRYGGGFDDFWEERCASAQRRLASLERARHARRAAQRGARASLERQERRERSGRAQAEAGGIPRILAGAQKRRAQETSGKLQRQAAAALESARQELAEAREAIVEDPFMRLDFESEAPPASRVFFEARRLNLRFAGQDRPLWSKGVDLLMKGQERWHIRGGNGSGKSTLLRLFMGDARGQASGYLWRAGRPLVYLDQALTMLRDDLSLLDNLSESRFGAVRLRNELALFGFRGDVVHQPVGTLSGGERLRAALARSFLGDSIPEVLLLDEPTNNLDFQSQELLSGALARFRGLLVIVSHDAAFVRDASITHILDLTQA
jgi:ATPase subunit of ABC transporter with duplicated ATPase domains